MGNLRGVAALPVVALLSCGGPQQPTSAKPAGSAQKSYQPLTIKTDAKLAEPGRDPRHRRPQRLDRAAAAGGADASALVDAMFVKLGAGTASGGSTPVKLSTAPNADGSVQVGVYEELAGGTGAQWRAGVWVSAFVAAIDARQGPHRLHVLGVDGRLHRRRVGIGPDGRRLPRGDDRREGRSARSR